MREVGAGGETGNEKEREGWREATSKKVCACEWEREKEREGGGGSE